MGTRAMTLLLMWAALVQAPRLTSSGELAALFRPTRFDVTVIDVRGRLHAVSRVAHPRALYLHVEELRAAEPPACRTSCSASCRTRRCSRGSA